MHNNNGGFITPILFVILGLIVISIGYYFYSSKVAVVPETVAPFSSNSTSTKPNASTADLKTYRNEQYGFEFKYQNDFVVSNEKSGLFRLSGEVPTGGGILLFNPDLEPSIGRGVGANGSATYEFDGIDVAVYPQISNSDSIPREGVGDTQRKVYQKTSLIGPYQAAYIYGKRNIYIFTTRSYDLDSVLSTFKEI